MTHTSDYDYTLPAELIAQHPLRQRADARLMVVHRERQTWDHAYVRDLPDLLEAGDCLVVNRSKVIPARLVGARADTGGRWEGLFLSTDDQGNWRVVFRTRGKMQPGIRVVLRDAEGRDRLVVRMLADLGEGMWAIRPEETHDNPWQTLEEVGHVPLPHYIRDGHMIDSDRESYQTVFADQPGSIAAPTAGLHFTQPLLRRCSDRQIDLASVTLHVGIGTFRPIKTEQLESHAMHAEWGEVGARCVDRVRQAQQAGRRIVAVGTTTTRILETAAADGPLQTWSGETSLFICPPYEFRVVNALLTNFHLPRSTLLVLAHTFAGHQLMQEAYEEAVRQKYRFYSYGDAMLIL